MTVSKPKAKHKGEQISAAIKSVHDSAYSEEPIVPLPQGLPSGLDSILDDKASLDGKVEIIYPKQMERDVFRTAAFREHISKMHHNSNPFESSPSNLERAAFEKKDEAEIEFQKDAVKQQEKGMLYGSKDSKEAHSLYGTKDGGANPSYGHATQSGDHLTCCNIDFFRDGNAQPHEEQKTTSYAAGPGQVQAAASGYIGARHEGADQSSVYGRSGGSSANMYKK